MEIRHVQIHYRHLFCNRICYRFATEFFSITGCYRIFFCGESVVNRSNRNKTSAITEMVRIFFGTDFKKCKLYFCIILLPEILSLRDHGTRGFYSLIGSPYGRLPLQSHCDDPYSPISMINASYERRWIKLGSEGISHS